MDDGGTATTNLYMVSELEIENPEAGASSDEVVHWYLHPTIRHEITRSGTERHVMHRDRLSSLVMMTDENADRATRRVYGLNPAPAARPMDVPQAVCCGRLQSPPPLPESGRYRPSR